LTAVDRVTRSDRPDLDDQVREAFRVKWPEFIFHDPVAHEYAERVGPLRVGENLWVRHR
jgi:hypothetical protein